jgi:hypothetical protein
MWHACLPRIAESCVGLGRVAALVLAEGQQSDVRSAALIDGFAILCF